MDVPGEDATPEEVDAWAQDVVTKMEEQQARATQPTRAEPNPEPGFHEPIDPPVPDATNPTDTPTDQEPVN